MKLTKATFDRTRYEAEQPGMTFSSHFELPEDSFPTFKEIYENGSETEMHRFLEQFPAYMSFALANTGHHGFWSKSKPQIRPPLINGEKGHIPDFLICGASSYGTQWFVLELKGPRSPLFNTKGTALSTVGNEGVTQLVEYVEYINRNLSTLQSSMEIPNLQPVKGILLIGTEEETADTPKKKALKSAWNNALNGIEIVSYSRIMGWTNEHFSFQKKRRESLASEQGA